MALGWLSEPCFRFGSKYANSTDGGDVNLKIAQLVFHELRDNGDTIEYSHTATMTSVGRRSEAFAVEVL